jgi:hypothetical protein
MGLAAVCAIAAPAAARADGVPSYPLVHAARAVRLGDRVLAIGMTGADVFHLQVLLARRRFPVAADRAFGPRTKAAVMRAQRRYGLTVDGIAGPLTVAALRDGGPPPCSSAPGPGDAVTRWAPVVACVLRMLHQRTAYVDAILLVIRYESGGNPFAINRWDVNARRGDPSRGLMQTIGRVFAAARSPALADSIYDPAADLYAGVNYAIRRYGSIAAIPGVKSIARGGRYVPYKMRLDRRTKALLARRRR